MKSNDFIPTIESQFYTWQGTLLNYMSAHAGLWGITEADWARLSALQSDYLAKYAIAENPATRTSAAILAKNKARNAYIKEIRLLVKSHITYNLVVTDEDRKDMGLPIHKTTRTPAQVALTYPEFHIDSGTIRRLIIHFYDQGQKKTKAKPPGQHGAEIRWAISDVPVIDVSELLHSSFDTHTPFTLEFQGHECGKTVYFCLCWENTRGQKGPWSKIISAVIP
jgi:uncharacterized protein YnzC (UPF0291/DUF896 family)